MSYLSRALHKGQTSRIESVDFGFPEDNEQLSVAGEGGDRWQGYSRKEAGVRLGRTLRAPTLPVIPNSELVYEMLS